MKLRVHFARTSTVLFLLSALAGDLLLGGSTPFLGVQLVSQVSDIGAPPPTRFDTTSRPRTNQALSTPTRQEWTHQAAAPPGESIIARARTMPQGLWAWLVIVGTFFISFVAVGPVARRPRRRHGVHSDSASPSSLGRAAAAQSQDGDPYVDLDDDERAEAMAYEAELRNDPTRAQLLHGEVPTRPGTVLTRRSLWGGAAVVVLVFFVFGAVVQHALLIAAAGAVLAVGMFAHGRGPARRIELSEHGDLIIYGGLWGRTVHLTDFTWARAYRTSTGQVRPATTVVLRRKPGRPLLPKAIGVWFPIVSRRRTTIALSSLWRCPAIGQRVSDNTMAEFIRMACRDSGMRVEQGSGQRIWTAERPR